MEASICLFARDKLPLNQAPIFLCPHPYIAQPRTVSQTGRDNHYSPLRSYKLHLHTINSIWLSLLFPTHHIPACPQESTQRGIFLQIFIIAHLSCRYVLCIPTVNVCFTAHLKNAEPCLDTNRVFLLINNLFDCSDDGITWRCQGSLVCHSSCTVCT